jgi:hypothetical protein
MPDLSSNRTAMRADGHKARTYLAVFGGVVVASGTLNSAPATGAKALAWTRTAGSSSDIRAGYRVIVETAGGALKFETSVRYSGTISDSNLPIREVASAEYTLSASDVVKVYNTPVLTDKLVEDNATFAPDGITYSAQNTTIAPIANSGGHWCGFVDAGQTYATIATQDASYTVDPDSGGSLAHLWTLPTGVAFAPGSASTDASPTLRADVGYAVVSHRVTDSTNSAQWTQYLVLRVYSAADPPVECVAESVDADETTGWNGRVRLFDNAALTAIPDRSLVAVFVSETINGAAASYGNRVSSRSHIKLLGYLVRDESEGDGADDRLTVEIISPWARLQEIPGFSKVLERYSSTTGWRYVQALTVKRAILQILRWYTNWTEYFDTVFQTFTDYDYPAFYVEKATPLAQLQELADGVDARVTGDRTGAMLIGTRQELVALASRSALTTTITLQDDDRVRYRFSRDHFKAVDTLECRGFVAATSTSGAVAIFSRYPGVPGRGAAVTATDRLIAASQSNLNDRCGLRGAAADGVFITAAGVYHRAVDLELTLPGAYDVFDPAYQEWVAFTGAAGNRRALDLAALRFVVRGVNVTYAGGTATTTVRLMSETAAPAGQTYVPKAMPGPQPQPPIEFPLPEFPTNPNPWLPTGNGRIALIGTKGLARTANFGAGGATVWDFVRWDALGLVTVPDGSGDAALTAVPDAFSYGTSAVKAWVLYGRGPDPARVMYLDIENRSWTIKTTMSDRCAFNDSQGGVGADASFGVQNHFVATNWRRGASSKIIYTTDNSTFTQVDTGTPNSTNDIYRIPIACWVSSRTPGRVLASKDGGGALLESTDYGATFSSVSNPNMAGGGFTIGPMHTPYDASRNAGESIWFYSHWIDNAVYRANGASRTAITPAASTKPFGPRNGFSTAIGNANRLLMACSGNGLWLTNNALAASPTWTQLTNATGYVYGCCAIAGDGANTFYFWDGWLAGAGGIAYSIDGGVTIVLQRGNLDSYDIGSIVMLVGW